MNKFFTQALVTGLFLGGGALLCEAQDEWTTLTSSDGRKIEAQIEKVEDGKVTFRTKAVPDRSYTLGFDRFAEKDQAFLEAWEPSSDTSANPVLANSRVTVVSEGETESIYRTRNFEFKSDRPIPVEEVNEFVVRFEATLHGFESLPLTIKPAPKNSHFKVRLIANDSNFKIISGQSLGDQEIGIYDLADDTFYALLSRVNVGLPLRYELSFALLGERLEKMPPWLAVGVADFIASAPKGEHQLDFSNHAAAVRQHVVEDLGMNATEMKIVAPEQLMAMTYGPFRTGNEETIKKNRASALLLFYFAGFLDGAGNGQGLRSYDRILMAGGTLEDALAQLVGDREWVRFNDDMKVKFLVKGIRLDVE